MCGESVPRLSGGIFVDFTLVCNGVICLPLGYGCRYQRWQNMPRDTAVGPFLESSITITTRQKKCLGPEQGDWRWKNHLVQGFPELAVSL